MHSEWAGFANCIFPLKVFDERMTAAVNVSCHRLFGRNQLQMGLVIEGLEIDMTTASVVRENGT